MKESIIIVNYGCRDRNNLNPNAACIVALTSYLQEFYKIDIITNNTIESNNIDYRKHGDVGIHAFPVKHYGNREFIDINTKIAQNYLIENIRVNDAKLCIAVSYPFMSSVFVMNHLHKLNPKLKKIIYEFDPLAYNGASDYILHKFLVRIVYETKEFLKADQIWLTRELYEQYNKNIFKLFKNKLINVGIPLFEKKGVSVSDNLNSSIKNSSRRINIVYSGTFYDKIRKPDYLIELMSRIVQVYDCDLHLYGTIIGSESTSVIRKAENTLGERLIMHGKINRGQVPIVLEQADILINVSNSIANQLPSKVFEYISTGKPIINISSIDNDSSRFYLERYPLALFIDESWDEHRIDENVKKVVEFCQLNTDKIISNDKLNKLYHEYSVSYIGDTLRANIARLINKL